MLVGMGVGGGRVNMYTENFGTSKDIKYLSPFLAEGNTEPLYSRRVYSDVATCRLVTTHGRGEYRFTECSLPSYMLHADIQHYTYIGLCGIREMQPLRPGGGGVATLS